MPSDSQPIILWLHNDLRLSDHRAWFEAAQNGAPVIPVYLHYKSIGGANRWWLHQSLAALQAELRTKNSDILLGVADSPESIAQQLSAIAKHYHTDKIFCHQPPTPFDGVQNKVISLAPSLHFTRFDQGHTLINPNELLNGQGQAYKVFTPFYKAFRVSHLPAPPLPAVKPSTFVPYQASQPLDALNLRPTIGWDADFYAHWQAGEVAAQIKLNGVLEGSFLTNYDTERNRPDIEGTSRLSPHLHFGEITPRQLIWALWDHPHADTFIREILWREFAYYIHAHFPHTFEQPFQAKWQGFQWEINAEALSRWQKGQTGIPLVDAGMRQLWQTGWMHNRVRMVVGSFLVKNLGIHWLEGARWFEDTLVDADIAVNRTSWQWVAGCGVDAAPYFRVFNPLTQGEKFDPQALYIKQFVPELAGVPAKDIHILNRLPSNYPKPIVDLKASREEALSRYKLLEGDTTPPVYPSLQNTLF